VELNRTCNHRQQLNDQFIIVSLLPKLQIGNEPPRVTPQDGRRDRPT
jgi:hypothetical protein